MHVNMVFQFILSLTINPKNLFSTLATVLYDFTICEKSLNFLALWSCFFILYEKWGILADRKEEKKISHQIQICLPQHPLHSFKAACLLALLWIYVYNNHLSRTDCIYFGEWHNGFSSTRWWIERDVNDCLFIKVWIMSISFVRIKFFLEEQFYNRACNLLFLLFYCIRELMTSSLISRPSFKLVTKSQTHKMMKEISSKLIGHWLLN